MFRAIETDTIWQREIKCYGDMARKLRDRLDADGQTALRGGYL
jgi:hypothetical protein